ncbi:MAG: deoxyhypusine synthase family protein [Candidatus Diapherotrites archaeon]
MKLKPVQQVKTRKGMKVEELAREMEQSGVMGSFALGNGISILEKMILDKTCTKFFGLAGALVPGGMRNVIAEMLEREYFDVLVCTGATLTHDLAEAVGFPHLQGSDKVDDEQLRKKNLDRVYSSYLQGKAYPHMEQFVRSALKGMKGNFSSSELMWKIGEKVKDKNSILAVCARKKIPIFVPALADSGIGMQVHWNFPQIRHDSFKDLDEVSALAWDAKRKGVFYVCGGVPKNFIQQALQFSPKPADYAVQLTTDVPQYGGSSGAELREGISWGKLNPKAKYQNIYCDATIALPFIAAALEERIR